MLGPNGSMYPWIAPFMLAVLGGTLLAVGKYQAGAILAILALLVRLLHLIAIDRGEVD